MARFLATYVIVHHGRPAMATMKSTVRNASVAARLYEPPERLGRPDMVALTYQLWYEAMRSCVHYSQPKTPKKVCRREKLQLMEPPSIHKHSFCRFLLGQ